MFYYSASKQLCVRIPRLKEVSRSKLFKPSKAQEGILLQAFSRRCEMENLQQQQNRDLQPIPDTSDRQGENNPRVFLKAKVIQAPSQLNPDSDKNFKFPGQPDPNNGKENFQTKYRFAARQELPSNLNLSQNCVVENPNNSSFANFHLFSFPIWQNRCSSQSCPTH